MKGSTPEGRFLDGQGDLRDRVIAMAEFIGWMAVFSPVDLDGDIYWVRRSTGDGDLGDDRLKDLDQMVVEWLRISRPDLLPKMPD